MDFGLFSLPVLALSLFFGYAIFYDYGTVIFHDVDVPADVEQQGYSSKVVATLLSNDVRKVVRRARTTLGFPAVTLPDDDEAIASLGEYFEILKPIRAAQSILKLTSYDFSGTIVHTGNGTELRLAVFGRDHVTKRSFHMAMTGGDLDRLVHDMALDVVRFLDPYIIAAYHYELAREGGFKDLGATERELRHCLVVMPKETLPWVYDLYGLVAFHQGKIDEAFERFDRALALNPNFPMALFNRGMVRLETNEIDAAIQSFKEALALAQNHRPLIGKANTQWGMALIKLDRLGEAEEKFQAAIKATPLDAEPYFHLGQIYQRWGRTKDAREMFQNAVDRAPNRQDFTAGLAGLT